MINKDLKVCIGAQCYIGAEQILDEGCNVMDVQTAADFLRQWADELEKKQ